MTLRAIAQASAFFLVATLGRGTLPTAAEAVSPNDNRIAAGVMNQRTLTLRLEARDGLWRPDGPTGPGLHVAVFAEAGRQAQNPGPLIRVRSGTALHVSVRNSLRDSTLVIYGLHSHPAALDDTIQVAAGASREVAFDAGAPGTYFYWATTTHHAVADRDGYDSQLHGAFIVDSARGTPPRDRIFVLGDWADTSRSDDRPQLRVINGLSWPHTERFSYSAGDTVRWRWVNPSDSPHPMHLHGFYFDVTSRGSYAADTSFAVAERPHVVTEMPMPGGTFAMTWIPDEPGRWLFHCHVAFHTSMFLSPLPVADPVDPVGMDVMKDSAGTMRGMVLGVTVRPGVSRVRRPAVIAGARAIRIVARATPHRFGALEGLTFVEDDSSRAPPDTAPELSSMLVLRRGEPVRITVVNHTRAPTGVHWHGIEVPAYSDGVPGMSGNGSMVSPMIAPRDSFTASFTPTRSGTFMYHSHSNESFQISLGMYGALLVVDPNTYDPVHERVVVLGGNGPAGRPARINGRLVPDTLRMKVGETYRIRLIDIIPDWTSRITLARDDSVVHWTPVAKDGVELRSASRVPIPATLISGPGQTMDFEYRPVAAGLMRLHVEQRTGSWKTYLPIMVFRR